MSRAMSMMGVVSLLIFCTVSSECGWYMKLPLFRSSKLVHEVLSALMCGCVTPPTSHAAHDEPTRSKRTRSPRFEHRRAVITEEHILTGCCPEHEQYNEENPNERRAHHVLHNEWSS